MKKSQAIIQHIEKIQNWNEEAVALAKKFMQTNDPKYKERSQKLFADIEYNKSLIKFIKGK